MTTIAAELEAIVWRRLFNDLIRERRTVAIIRIFFAPVTKAGAKDAGLCGHLREIRVGQMGRGDQSRRRHPAVAADLL